MSTQNVPQQRVAWERLWRILLASRPVERDREESPERATERLEEGVDPAGSGA